tara:strand:+ start:125 stop:439 length:315 start_codon:yes stop_codon:yes gene_type:complete
MEDRYEVVQWKTTSMYAIRPKSGGRSPKELSGTYTKESIAKQAIKAYQKVRDKYKPETSPLIELDKLTKKPHLLEFAEIMKIEVPESMNQPASIKKFIKDKLES